MSGRASRELALQRLQDVAKSLGFDARAMKKLGIFGRVRGHEALLENVRVLREDLGGGGDERGVGLFGGEPHPCESLFQVLVERAERAPNHCDAGCCLLFGLKDGQQVAGLRPARPLRDDRARP